MSAMNVRSLTQSMEWITLLYINNISKATNKLLQYLDIIENYKPIKSS